MPTDLKRPTTNGELTRSQHHDRAGYVDAALLGAALHKGGFAPPPPATAKTYRAMRNHPTIFLARTVAWTPILAAQDPTVEGDAPEQAIADAQRLVDRFFWKFVRHALSSLDFGYAAWEKVWGGSGSNIQIERLKPLVAWETHPILDKQTGEWLGIKQDAVELERERAIWYTNGGYADDPYGESRLYGIRGVWQHWNDATKQLGVYLNKVAGVIPLIEYPEGESQNSGGQTKSNFDIAVGIAGALAAGKGVVMPNTLANWSKELIRSGAKPDDIKAWRIQFLEAKGDYSTGILEVMRQADRYMVRGYAVPERAALEGQFGTKADASTHTDITVDASQQTIDDITEEFQNQVIRQELLFRYGQAVADAVALRSPALTDEAQALLGSMIQALVSGGGLEVLAPILDIRAILERRGVPAVPEGQENAIPAQNPAAPQMMSMVKAAWERHYGHSR